MGDRRLVMPPNRVKVDLSTTVVVPDIGSAMSNAVTIISNELAQYCSKTARGITLDLKEARIVKEYVAALVSLSKESREQARADDLSNMTNEELLELATKLVSKNNKTTISNEIKTNSSNEEDQQDED